MTKEQNRPMYVPPALDARAVAEEAFETWLWNAPFAINLLDPSLVVALRRGAVEAMLRQPQNTLPKLHRLAPVISEESSELRSVKTQFVSDQQLPLNPVEFGPQVAQPVIAEPPRPEPSAINPPITSPSVASPSLTSLPTAVTREIQATPMTPTAATQLSAGSAARPAWQQRSWISPLTGIDDALKDEEWTRSTERWLEGRSTLEGETRRIRVNAALDILSIQRSTRDPELLDQILSEYRSLGHLPYLEAVRGMEDSDITEIITSEQAPAWLPRPTSLSSMAARLPVLRRRMDPAAQAAQSSPALEITRRLHNLIKTSRGTSAVSRARKELERAGHAEASDVLRRIWQLSATELSLVAYGSANLPSEDLEILGRIDRAMAREIGDAYRQVAENTSSAPQPAAVQPVLKPAAVQPAAVQPAAVQPAAVQPAAVQPAAVQPAAVQSVIKPALRSATAEEPQSMASALKEYEAAKPAAQDRPSAAAGIPLNQRNPELAGQLKQLDLLEEISIPELESSTVQTKSKRESKATESKVAGAKVAESKVAESKVAESKAAESKAAESKESAPRRRVPTTAPSAEIKPAEIKPAGAHPAKSTPESSKPAIPVVTPEELARQRALVLHRRTEAQRIVTGLLALRPVEEVSEGLSMLDLTFTPAQLREAERGEHDPTDQSLRDLATAAGLLTEEWKAEEAEDDLDPTQLFKQVERAQPARLKNGKLVQNHRQQVRYLEEQMEEHGTVSLSEFARAVGMSRNEALRLINNHKRFYATPHDDKIHSE